MPCINCSTEFSGNFCPQCGQRTGVNRITLREAWNDFWSRIYGFDGMFPRTLRDLTIRPGHVARKYMEGNRVLYYGPVGYCFLMVAVLLLLLDFMGLSFAELMNAAPPDALKPATEKQAAFAQKMQQLVANNIRLFFFAWIPFQATMAKFLFFRKANMNFLEHLVMPFYLMGHGLWLTIVMAVLVKFGFTSSMWIAVISILYFAFAYSDLMRYQNRVKAYFKGLGVWVTAYILFILAFTLVLFGVIVLVAFISPETVKNWFS